MHINIEEVPTAVRRRAAQLLENVRGTQMDPTGGKASLSDAVTAIFRPDIDDVAYYEFAVDLGRSEGRKTAISGKGDLTQGRALPAGQGFIIAASDGHDHPIAHWSLDREPPSRQIAAVAEEKGHKIARLFKLDALSYVGETSDGELAGQSGQMPTPIEGLPADLAKAAGRISSTLARPSEATKSDERVSKRPHEIVTKGARPQKFKLSEVAAWKDLRDSYREAFGPLLKGLAQQASPAWEIEHLVAKLGEGIMTGGTHTVALLEADAMVEVSGDGAKLIKIEPLDTAGSGGAVKLHVADEKLPQEVSFDLHISYRSGMREKLQFFAVSPTTPSDKKPDSGLNIFEE